MNMVAGIRLRRGGLSRASMSDLRQQVVTSVHDFFLDRRQEVGNGRTIRGLTFNRLLVSGGRSFLDLPVVLDHFFDGQELPQDGWIILYDLCHVWVQLLLSENGRVDVFVGDIVGCSGDCTLIGVSEQVDAGD